ncbi:MAG: hypothetical protein PVG39_09685 [Desulfobacteraceae bacterium]
MYGGPPLGFFAIVFGFVIVMVIIKTIGNVLKEKAKAQTYNKKDDEYIDYDLRLKKLEERIANLETIVLEQERYNKFSAL